MGSESRSAGIAYATFTAAAALITAVATHCFIDIVANFVLPHDTYDDGAHESRALVLGVAALLFVCYLAVRILDALNPRQHGPALRSSQRLSTSVLRAYPRGDKETRGLLAWLVLVITWATVLLATMGWFDATIDHLTIDDPGDLFGGSVWLGIGSSAFVGIIVAAGCVRLARWFSAHQESIVASLVAFVSREQGISSRNHLYANREREYRFTLFKNSPLAYRAGKRGPPQLLRIFSS